MGADYYPRLTSVATNKAMMNRMVNEQTEIGLLLGVPGLLATLCLAPWIVTLFYTAEFHPAVELLQWFVLGCLGRIVSWPMGMVMLAMGKNRWLFVTETAFILTHLVLIYSMLNWLGLQGVAIAFCIMYVGHIAATWYAASQLCEFTWSSNTRALLMVLAILVGLQFSVVRILPLWPSTLFGGAIACIASLYCLRGLVVRIGANHRITNTIKRVPGLKWIILTGIKLKT
jgi:antigen flippase